jgi:SnoaL-like domain
MGSDERITKFRKFIEAWTKHNLAVVDELMAPDVVYHMPPFPIFQTQDPSSGS